MNRFDCRACERCQTKHAGETTALEAVLSADEERQEIEVKCDALTDLLTDGTLDAEVPSMQTRGRLYELLDYEAYNAFDASIYTYNGR